MKGRIKSYFIALKMSRICRYLDKRGIETRDFHIDYDGTAKGFYARSKSDIKVGY